MKEFAKEARRHGLLFVPMRDKANPGVIEIAVFAQDAAKVNRIMDRLCLDFVKAAGAKLCRSRRPKRVRMHRQSRLCRPKRSRCRTAR